MTIKFGRSRRYLITKNLILMLVMVVLIILAVLAWFTFTKTVSAEQITVKAISSQIDIAECVKTYGYSSQDEQTLTDGPGVFGDTVTFGPYNLKKDCTGDGENLIVPDFNVAKDFVEVKQTGKEVNLNGTPRDAYSNLYSDKQKRLHPDQDPIDYEYIQCEFYVRSKNKELDLSGESYLISESEENSINLFSTPSSDKQSAYGNFNVDALVGAIRVAFNAESCISCSQHWENGSLIREGTNAPNTGRASSEKTLLWLPRPDVYLNVSTGSEINNWTIQHSPLNPANAEETTLHNKTYKHTYYKQTGSGLTFEDPDSSGKTKCSSALDNNIPILGQNYNITDFDNVNPTKINGIVVDSSDTSVTDEYYLTKITMNIWIEGSDAEARRAMDRAKFSLKLFFE